MKKMENIGDALFAPLTGEEERRATAALIPVMTQHFSFIETNDPNPDESFDIG
jgi:hypothetical protein